MVQIRRKSFLALGTVGTAAFLAACGSNDDSSDSSASDGGGASDAGGSGDAPARADADLVVWADDKKAESLQGPAKTWADANGLTIAVQAVSGDLQGSFVTANQAGNGPDVVIGAHDWIGNLVQNGAIAPVQLPADAQQKVAPVGLTAVTYDGQVYGVPYSVETLALFANKTLTQVPEPKSIEELVSAAQAGGAENPLSLPIGEAGDAYHMEPLYSSAGGYLFKRNDDGTYDTSDLGVGKEGSIAAAEKMHDLGQQGVLKTTISGDNAISLFTDGKAAYLISGPWALSDIKTAKVDFAMAAVPGFEGMQPARSFAGVNAFYVATKAKNQAFAVQFVNAVATDPSIAEGMFGVNELPPTSLDLQQSLAADNPEMVQIAQYAENADPMPAIPQMQEVWGPLGQAEANIVKGADPTSTMESAGQEITSKI
ncbi:extracellular solute-binding protein [Brachybacterium huguangmaarense]|uniref:Extracellular solute-binding protein n=1 Tax=Brachybacterium huguangmaarense TaxID=1652028 RepID=A0ABY6G0J9_9MICO|nr:extracellular solute-binding protein [Brachybacterium huguangmaarense]UYG16720.1 extracellular solute-binding protein [Brachybacterium huguangmaarense]